ncbi:MAG: restriction endonuclease subunit S [Candidatus Omnitrophica bacterium]|nr:restriction endonuclease subunit S [Candidatus Omnitrophota bacterium]
MKQKTKLKETEIGMIPEDWEMVTIPDVASNFDNKRKPLSSAERSKSKGQYPYYGAAGIIDYVNDYKYDGDYLLIAEDGTVTCDGFKPMLQLPRGKFWVSNHAHVLQSDSYGNTLFLYYQLKNTTINAFITGAVQPKLSQENLNKIKFPWVKNDEERRAITKILSDLDAKIELNRRMNKTLGSIAQAIFKRWFVDFEFPGYEKAKFVDGLPQGWLKGKLIDICDIVMGQSPPGETYNESGEGAVFYQGNRDFGFRFPTPRVYCTAPTRIAEAKDILISVRAPVGALNITLGKCAIGRGVAALRMKNYSNGFLFYFLVTRKDLWDRFNSEGTVFGCLNKKEFHKIDVVIPADAIMQQFDIVINSIEAMIRKNEEENRRLTEVRDSLLPRLMSGKIRVDSIKN